MIPNPIGSKHFFASSLFLDAPCFDRYFLFSGLFLSVDRRLNSFPVQTISHLVTRPRSALVLAQAKKGINFCETERG